MKFKADYFPAPRKSPQGWKRLRQLEVAMLEEEVDILSEKLLDRFPEGRMFSEKYHRGKSASWIGTEGIQFASTLTAASRAGNTVQAVFRVPWPIDILSGDPIRLIGGVEVSQLENRAHFRQMGRCIAVSWQSQQQKPIIRVPVLKEQNGHQVDYSFDLVHTPLTINALFDAEDAEVTSFLDEVEKILLEMTTCDFASYDLYTHALINPKRHRSTDRRSAGVVRYAALHDNTYLGFCGPRGIVSEVMGVRPDIRAALRGEAGLTV
ncbi:MAG: hypothetical protein IPK59_19370 [Rhodospirillaceae bacterium]|nr:hypothetical protein [Rhodospirillaceae bacterium]